MLAVELAVTPNHQPGASTPLIPSWLHRRMPRLPLAQNPTNKPTAGRAPDRTHFRPGAAVVSARAGAAPVGGEWAVNSPPAGDAMEDPHAHLPQPDCRQPLPAVRHPCLLRGECPAAPP